MSDHAKKFVDHLQALKLNNRGALAVLRRSLAFPPGSYPPAYPFVERFVPADSHAQDGRRLSLYLSAALYAIHPESTEQGFAASLGKLFIALDKRPSLEQRFVALLGTDAEGLPDHLRQAVSLLAAAGIGFDHAALADDLAPWLQPNFTRYPERLEAIRQRWAREYYRNALAGNTPDSSSN